MDTIKFKKYHFTPEFEEVFFPLLEYLYDLKVDQTVHGYFPPSCHILRPLIKKYFEFCEGKKESDFYYAITD